MRDYADKLADAMGAGYDSFTATLYARGSFRLPRPARRSIVRAKLYRNSGYDDYYPQPETANSTNRLPGKDNSANQPDKAPRTRTKDNDEEEASPSQAGAPSQNGKLT